MMYAEGDLSKDAINLRNQGDIRADDEYIYIYQCRWRWITIKLSSKKKGLMHCRKAGSGGSQMPQIKDPFQFGRRLINHPVGIYYVIRTIGIYPGKGTKKSSFVAYQRLVKILCPAVIKYQYRFVLYLKNHRATQRSISFRIFISI